VLRIIDDRTGEPVQAAPARRGLTRIEAHATGYDTTSLRVLLVADLLVRALELGGTPVWALLSAERQQDELRAGAAALGVRPLEDGHDTAGLGETQVVHVSRADRPAPDGVLLTVGAVELAPGGPPRDAGPGPARRAAHAAGGPPAGTASAAVPGGLPAGSGAAGREPVAPAAGAASFEAVSGGLPMGVEPAVVRLALLSVPRRETVRLGPAVLGEARDTLARWRRAVADWARRPSRPVPDEVRARLRAAWEDDLDIPAVLRVLGQVAEAPAEDVPDGARFETYVHADRLLGLDLARDLGAPS
jgi:hypothetical protein